MLCIDLNKRISWNDYFNHQFFHIKKEKYENKIQKQDFFQIIGNKLNKNIEVNKQKNNNKNEMYQQKDFNKILNMPDKNLNDEITKKIENNEKKKFDPKQYENKGFSYDEIIELKEAFDTFDTNNSGFVNKSELKEHCKNLEKQIKLIKI